MKELSIFVDESGDFGPYEHHSPYYIIGFVLHDQSKSVKKACAFLDKSLSQMGLSKDHNIHTAPLIRREGGYRNMVIRDRKALFNQLVIFSKYIDFSWHPIHIRKKGLDTQEKLAQRIKLQVENFIKDHLVFLLSYDCIKIYYDNGQAEITKILHETFGKLLNNVKWRKATPIKYKLLQLADLTCTLELLELKLKTNTLSKSEQTFFGTTRNLRKNYLNLAKKKKL